MSIVQISQIDEKVTVLEVQGRINLGNYQELQQVAQDAYDRGVRNIILDLMKVDALTSIGIRALVAIHKTLDANKEGKLKLAGVKAPIKEMFEVAGINQFLEIYDTAADAVKTF